MSVKYADRGFITFNGARIQDIQSCSVKQNRNARVVPSMTTDRFNKGYVEGNTDIDVTFQIAVQNGLQRPKLDFLAADSNDLALVLVFGADQYIVSGLFNKDSEDNAGGIGDEVKTTFNFGALKIADGAGNSILFGLDLALA